MPAALPSLFCMSLSPYKSSTFPKLKPQGFLFHSTTPSLLGVAQGNIPFVPLYHLVISLCVYIYEYERQKMVKSPNDDIFY